MRLTRLLLATTIATLIPGQLVRLSVSSGAITLTDIFAFLTFAVFLLETLVSNKTLKLPKSVFIPAILFLLSATASTVLALNFFAPNQILVASIFLLRFAIYFSLSVVTFNIIARKEIDPWTHFILGVGFVFSLIGVIQIIFLPDISFLQEFGWDPHQMRLVATTLDPNFSGGIISIVAIFATSLYLFKNRLIYLFLAIFFSLALFLTFSRSSYLALLFSMSVVGFIKSPRVILIAIAVFSIVFLLIPQARNRIIGAFTLDDTASARIESWQKAIIIFRDNPVFGVGFNTYRYAQAKYDFFAQDDTLGGHSGAGSDSSFLFVAATTGILGLLFFLMLNLSILKNFAKNSRTSYLKLASLASLAGILIHTQFVNALFFPQTMMLFWFIVGLNLAYDD